MTFPIGPACGRLDPEPVARPAHCLHRASDRTKRGLCKNCGRFVGPVLEPRCAFCQTLIADATWMEKLPPRLKDAALRLGYCEYCAMNVQGEQS